MKERPILFSAPMVRAILAGTKTQTRRLVKPQPPANAHQVETWHHPDTKPRFFTCTTAGQRLPLVTDRPCPYGQPGDRLWVRETWQAIDGNERARRIMTQPNPSRGWIEYAATVPEGYEPPPRWRPRIHMPRWASRITLEVTGVRVERLGDVSESDARAEGVQSVAEFKELWASINGPSSWDANPWVWVVEFKRLEGAA